jgi:glycerol-3-phosphate dehydrogenase (NAD(P)+)
MSRATIIGDGGWGTSLALLLHRNGHSVTVWGPFADYIATVNSAHVNATYLPGVSLPREIVFTSDRKSAVTGADVVILAVPTRFFRDVLQSFRGLIPPNAAVLSVTKGLDMRTRQRMSEVAEEVGGHGPAAALSGPSYALEVARGIPTAVVVASRQPDQAKAFQQMLSNPQFRVYTSEDVVGVEIGGALKNIIAIAAGVCDGLGFGHNAKAALVTRGLAEITRIGVALGANPLTFAGLSGVGDLIVTCTGNLSRNRMVGEKLGRGESIDAILGNMKQEAEGVWNCATALALAKRLGVEAPITAEVHAIIHEKKHPLDALKSLLARSSKPEIG